MYRSVVFNILIYTENQYYNNYVGRAITKIAGLLRAFLIELQNEKTKSKIPTYSPIVKKTKISIKKISTLDAPN